MTRKEFIEKARNAGLLVEGIRMGIINSTQVRNEQAVDFYKGQRQKGLSYTDAVYETSIYFQISYSYVTRIISGAL